MPALTVGSFDPERAGCVFGTDYMLTLPEDFSEAINHCRDGGRRVRLFAAGAARGWPRSRRSGC